MKTISRLTPETPVLVNGEEETTWAEFYKSNSEGLDDEEIRQILFCLENGAQYLGGGGAAATWSIERI